MENEKKIKEEKLKALGVPDSFIKNKPDKELSDAKNILTKDLIENKSAKALLDAVDMFTRLDNLESDKK
jgi:hypothetical protein